MRAVGGVRERERRVQVGVDRRAAAAAARAPSTATAPVDVAGLEAVQPDRRGALGVADDELAAVAVDGPAGMIVSSCSLRVEVADLHGGAQARHRPTR